MAGEVRHNPEWFKRVSKNLSQTSAKERKQEKFLGLLREGCKVEDACAGVGISLSGYYQWRRRNRTFAAVADEARLGRRDLPPRDFWDGGFADFRKRFFGHDSPWFHLLVVDALENGAPGSVTLVLLPPEHGKTTLVEDYCTFKLSTDPSFRITYGSARIDHARKCLGRIMSRMEAEGPCKELVARFGPFAPQKGQDRSKRQPWGVEAFDVYKKGESDERDYSMVAVGVNAHVQGTRTDLLVLDDLQSLKTLNLTPDIVEKVRQDFLSRPGSKGRTVIVGTRVGEDDCYSAFMDEGLVDRLICIPAYKESESPPWPDPRTINPLEPKKVPVPDGVKFLWPDRYSPQEYNVMRCNTGETAWDRNYMQKPTAKGDSPFDDQMIADLKVPLRAVFHDPPPEYRYLVATLDPGFGTNAVMVVGMNDRKMAPLSWRLDYNLLTNEQILGIVEEYCHRYPDPDNPGGTLIRELVIEDKAHQKGMLHDPATEALIARFGLRVTGHQTGDSKNDENIGIRGMVHTMLRREIELPGSDDAATVVLYEQLRKQLTTWRPYRRGNRLTQDLVITLWFAWLRWRSLRGTLATMPASNHGKPAPPSAAGLPFTPTGLAATTSSGYKPLGLGGLVRRG